MKYSQITNVVDNKENIKDLNMFVEEFLTFN